MRTRRFEDLKIEKLEDSQTRTKARKKPKICNDEHRAKMCQRSSIIYEYIREDIYIFESEYSYSSKKKGEKGEKREK